MLSRVRASPFAGLGEANRANAAVLLLNAAEGAVITILSPFLGSQGYPLASIGFLVSIYAVASLLSRLPSGRLSEGALARRWYIGACCLAAASLLLYPAVPAGWMLWAVRCLHGLAAGTASTLNFAAFLAASSGKERGRATALYTTALSGGYASGNFASGFLSDHFGYGAAFLVAALCAAAAMLLGPRVQRPRPSPRRQLEAPLRRPSVLRRWDVLAIPLLAFSISFIHMVLNTLFPLYALAIGHSLSLVGVTRGVQSFTNTIVRPFGDPLLRRLGIVGMACLGLAVNALAVAGVPLVSAPLLLLALFIAVGASRAFAIVANTLNTAEMHERGVINRGTASALISVGTDAGMVLAPMVAGLTAAQIGIGPALQMLPIAAVALGLGSMLQANRRAPAQAPSLAPVGAGPTDLDPD